MKRKSEGNRSKVRRDRGTYVATIPKALGEAFRLEGAQLEWVPSGPDRFIVIIHRSEVSNAPRPNP